MDTLIQPPSVNSSSRSDDSRYFLRPMRSHGKRQLDPHRSRFESLEALLMTDPAPAVVLAENTSGEVQACWLAPELPRPVVIGGESVPIVGSLKDLLFTYSVPALSGDSYLTDDMLFVSGPTASAAYMAADAGRKSGGWKQRASFAISRVKGQHHVNAALITIISTIAVTVALKDGWFAPFVLFASALSFGYLGMEIVTGVLRAASLRALTRDSVREVVFLRVPLSYSLLTVPLTILFATWPIPTVLGLGLGALVSRVSDAVVRIRRGAVLLGLDGGPVWPFLGRSWEAEVPAWANR